MAIDDGLGTKMPWAGTAPPQTKTGIIGKAIRIKGELRGREDLRIEGKIEGSINLVDNHLILEPAAEIKADVEVNNITIKGVMYGNTKASDKVEIAENAKVMGDIKAPRLVMKEGARFKGFVDMEVPLPDELLASAKTRDTAEKSSSPAEWQQAEGWSLDS